MTATKNICRRRTWDGSNYRGILGSSNIELKVSSVCANFALTAYATDKDKVFGTVLYINKWIKGHDVLPDIRDIWSLWT